MAKTAFAASPPAADAAAVVVASASKYCAAEKSLLLFLSRFFPPASSSLPPLPLFPPVQAKVANVALDGEDDGDDVDVDNEELISAGNNKHTDGKEGSSFLRLNS